MTPKVTVLMAVRNGEPYVGEAVRSVIDQTFTDFEFVVVDDGSTDASASIVAELDDARIRLLRNERNIGQVPSLNRGLREARGEYVARIDADDACLPERLERQVEVLDANPRVGLVGTWLDGVDERGRKVAELRKELEDYVDFLYHTLIMRVYVSHPSAMYRREPVLALGGYDERTEPAEDKDLWRKLALARFEARIVPAPLVRYRLHDRQLSQTRAAYQRSVDDASQDRFLAELAPRAPATAVRRLLSGDELAWAAEPRATLEGVEVVIADARDRLALDDEEASALRAKLARRLLEVASARPWHRSARVVAAHGLDALPQAERGAARRRFATAFIVAPVRAAVRYAARAAAGRAGALAAPARRLRLARRLYAKAIGSE